MSFEQSVFTADSAFVYQLDPAAAGEGGYRAKTWGLDEPFWVVSVKVSTTDTGVMVRLYDVKNGTGDLFAECPYDLGGNTVQEVIDSSRYFALRVVSGGQVAYLGLGFNDRGDSFGFKTALFDSNARVKRGKEAKEHFAERRQQIAEQNLGLTEVQSIGVGFQVGYVAQAAGDEDAGVQSATAQRSSQLLEQMKAEEDGGGDDFLSAQAPPAGRRRRRR